MSNAFKAFSYVVARQESADDAFNLSKEFLQLYAYLFSTDSGFEAIIKHTDSLASHIRKEHKRPDLAEELVNDIVPRIDKFIKPSSMQNLMQIIDWYVKDETKKTVLLASIAKCATQKIPQTLKL